MDVLIINPPIRLSDKPRHIPHGLAILASIIRRKLNISPTFVDINAYRYNDEEVKNSIRNTKFDIVLIGGLSPVYKYIVELSRWIKSLNNKAKIVVGGYVAISAPEILINNSGADIICIGEGEVTIIELLNKLSRDPQGSLEGMAGICYKNNEKEIVFNSARSFIQNLDVESALPAYDLLPMEIYLSNPVVGIGRDIDFISGRGCPYQCTFCYQPFGHRPRNHSIDFVIKAIHFLREQYHIDFISFQDDEFLSDVKRVIKFCEARNHSFPELLWSCTGRANIVARNEELVKIMRDSGCTLISFGFESGSQGMLDRMRKSQTVQMLERTVKICRKYGLPIPASFIIGMPGEDDRSCKETVDFCLRNNLPLDSLMFATPYPGTEIFDFAKRTKRIDKNCLHEYLTKLGDARDFTINLTDYFSDEGLINKRQEMMEITRANYNRFITEDVVKDKMRNLFGGLMERRHFDDKDLEHRLKHGGMSIF